MFNNKEMIQILFFLMIFFVGCTHNNNISKVVSNKSILDYSNANRNIVKINSNKKKSQPNYQEIHQDNGFSILGNFINGKPNGKVKIIYVNKEDLLEYINSIGGTKKNWLDVVEIHNLLPIKNKSNLSSYSYEVY